MYKNYILHTTYYLCKKTSTGQTWKDKRDEHPEKKTFFPSPPLMMKKKKIDHMCKKKNKQTNKKAA